MQLSIVPILSLLAGTAILLLGGGLYGTLLAIRAGAEGFSAGTVGLIMSAYYAGFLIGCLKCPRLIERVGHIRTYAALTAVASAASLGHALILDAVSWAALRGVAGFCFAGLYMIIESWLNEKVDRESRGRIFAIYMMVNLGSIAFGQLFLLFADPRSFTLFCAVSILISLAAVPLSLTRVAPPAQQRMVRLTVRRLWTISPLGLVACFGVGVGQGTFWSLTPLFTAEAGFSERGTALFMTTAVFGGLFLQWPIGWLSDRYDRRAVISAICAMTAIVAAVLVALGRHQAGHYLIPTAAVFGGLSFTIYSLAVAHANDFNKETGIVALSASLLLVYAVGATLGPVAAGWIADLTTAGAVFAFIAAIYLAVSGFSVWRMTRRAAPPPSEHGPFVGMARAGPYASMIDPRVEDDPAPVRDDADD